MTTLAQPFATSTSGLILLPTITVLLATLILAAVKYLPSNFRAIRDNQASLKTSLDTVTKEVRTNSGGSLKDAVLRIEVQQAALTDKLDRHLSEASYQQGRLDRLIERDGGGHE